MTGAHRDYTLSSYQQTKARPDSHPEWQPSHRYLAKIANQRSRQDIPIQTTVSAPQGYPPVLQE